MHQAALLRHICTHSPQSTPIVTARAPQTTTMKNFHNLQLALYSVIVASILVWLLVALLDNAAFAIGGYYDSDSDCDFTIHHEAFAVPLEEDTTTTKKELPFYKKLQELITSTESVIMPPEYSGGDGHGAGDDRSNLIISDILAKTPRINVFASLTRDFDPVVSRLADQTANTTVLAPLNSAINDLPRKPWEDPEDYARYGEVDAYKGGDGQDRAKRNLLRFVRAHLVPASPWAEGEELETLGGGKVKWIKEGDRIFVSWHLSSEIYWSRKANTEFLYRLNLAMLKSIFGRHMFPTARSGF